MKTQRIIEKHRKLFQRDNDAVELRREEWEGFTTRAESFFAAAISAFGDEPLLGKLQLTGSKMPLMERKHHNSFGLGFSIRPTGIMVTERDFEGKFISGHRDIEKGGAILYSQAPNGEVVCLIYACESEFLKPKDKYFVFKRYRSPANIDEAEMKRGLRVFLWYVRISSYMQNLSLLDTFRLNFLKLRSFRSRPDWNSIIGVVGAIIGILSIISVIL